MDVKQSQAGTTSTGRSDQAGQQGAIQRNEEGTGRQQEDANRMARRDAYPLLGPFALLQRILTDDIAGFFDQRTRLARPRAKSGDTDEVAAWVPRIDVVQRANELVIRADLPGMTPDDVTVEVTEDAVTISGQRRQEQVEEKDGVYRRERSYGAFYREIPLPEGAIADRATATFKDGVLEITVPAPPEQVSRGRRLEIHK